MVVYCDSVILIYWLDQVICMHQLRAEALAYKHFNQEEIN